MSNTRDPRTDPRPGDELEMTIDGRDDAILVEHVGHFVYFRVFSSGLPADRSRWDWQDFTRNARVVARGDERSRDMPETEYAHEIVLEDDYPVFCDYWYVVDGKPVRSPIEGDVRSLRRALKCDEIRRCEIVARMARQSQSTETRGPRAALVEDA